MKYGLGWRKDPLKPPGAKGDYNAAFLLDAMAPPDAASIAFAFPDVLDQKAENSCVANAGDAAIRARQIAQLVQSGLSIANAVASVPLGSRHFGYYLSRATSHEAQRDEGTYIRNFFSMCAEFGVPPETAWPYVVDGSHVFAPPPPTVFRAAYDTSDRVALRLSYHRIYASGFDRVDAVKRAIAGGFPVVFGTLVDQEFVEGDFSKGPLGPALGEIVGGHALAIAEYDGDEFRGPNSWGEGWGNHGWYRLTADALATENADDFWIVEVAP